MTGKWLDPFQVQHFIRLLCNEQKTHFFLLRSGELLWHKEEEKRRKSRWVICVWLCAPVSKCRASAHPEGGVFLDLVHFCNHHRELVVQDLTECSQWWSGHGQESYQSRGRSEACKSWASVIRPRPKQNNKQTIKNNWRKANLLFIFYRFWRWFVVNSVNLPNVKSRGRCWCTDAQCS